MYDEAECEMRPQSFVHPRDLIPVRSYKGLYWITQESMKGLPEIGWRELHMP